jgi:hypothetical protein
MMWRNEVAMTSSEMQPSELDAEASWELLQRVVNSLELRRATRLRELLIYLGERSLKSHAASIREQEIGAAVFGRPESYDTNIDNIVRVNVSELRKRLSHYFESEGMHEPVLMEIPRGGYLPVFLPRPAMPEVVSFAEVESHNGSSGVSDGVDHPAVSEDLSAVPNSARASGAVWNWILGAGLVLALGAVAALLLQVRSLRMQPWQSDANREAFWSQFFASGEPVDIVTADTSYALAEDLLHRPISLDDYLDYQYKNYDKLPNLSPEKRDALDEVLDRNTGSVGDFEAAEHILELNPRSPLLRLASARSYTPQNIKTHNVILIGARQSNPWLELYQNRMNFDVEYDPALHRSHVLNRAPINGEQSTYEVINDRNRDYSVVAFFPNLSDHRYTLILAGTDSQGTRAAGEFITSSEGLAAIRQRLPADQNPYFEVLLYSTRLEGTTLQTMVVATRGYKR